MEHPPWICHSPALVLPALIRTLRPKQWVKNIFVGVALVFSQRLGDTDSFVRTLAAFWLFCLISGCVYVVNDLVDVEKDRAPPKKRSRPIASGALSPRIARAFVQIAVPATIVCAFALSPWLAAVLVGYFVQNLVYCFWIKRVPYLDVFSIAIGFVLRVLAGAITISVPASAWLMGCTALLAMLMGFGKRAHELATQDGSKTRPSLAGYNRAVLRVVLYALALAALVAITGAGLLAVSALKDEAAYFYAPNDVKTKGVEPGKAIRLGGMVVKGSLKRAADGVTINFDVTDGKATVPATFSGIAPDLFKEGSGVVAEGAFDRQGRFVATNLLAKHDERYMPRELDGMTYNETTHEMKAAP